MSWTKNKRTFKGPSSSAYFLYLIELSLWMLVVSPASRPQYGESTCRRNDLQAKRPVSAINLCKKTIILDPFKWLTFINIQLSPINRKLKQYCESFTSVINFFDPKRSSGWSVPWIYLHTMRHTLCKFLIPRLCFLQSLLKPFDNYSNAYMYQYIQTYQALYAIKFALLFWFQDLKETLKGR